MIPFRYRLGDAGLEVLLGPYVVRQVAYNNMESVEKGCAFWNEHWTNIWPWKFISIRRKNGWFRNFVINPMERDDFIMELRHRMAQTPRKP